MDYTRYLIQIIYLITLFEIFNTSEFVTSYGDVSTNATDFRTNDDVSNMLQSMFVDLPSTWTPNSQNAAAQFYSSTSKIIFLKNSTYCTMYSKRCFVRVIIGDLKLKKSLKIRTQSRKIIEFKSIESCLFTSNNSLVRKECKLAIDEYNNNMNLNSFLTINGNNNISRFGVENFFLIRVRAKLVGIRNLEIEYLDQTSSKNVQDSRVVKLEHRVIVTRPDRFIDTFQVVYIVIFSILISVIMGILLDVSTLIKIIKMPIPVLIGFISQYLVMPLVSFQIVLLIFYTKIPQIQIV